ncbi:MAG: S-methyl-5'-thioadenosine phosphorylase [Phycisphaerae bacterium]|jgi:5'-methylthioadenosine phosphorylase|nr:S-methyl-5'-thioadenosine phosphorylase [Phycisphaerae bacterium]
MSEDVLVGLIGGTGLGEVFGGQIRGEAVEADTPFGKPSSPITMSEVGGQSVAFLQRHGEGHVLNPSRVNYRANIFALKQIGVKHIIASGACGSFREEIAPRDLVIPDQIIDRTIRPGRTFFEDMAVHVEFSHPFCESLREVLLASAAEAGAKVHPAGTYLCMEGPQFSTRAESILHKSWGADIIGMTVMPEARLAREAEICYALVAIPTDYDCWKPHEPGADAQTVLKAVIENVEAGTCAAAELIRAAVPKIADAAAEACPCSEALKLAIWSDWGKTSPAVLRRLQPLLKKYF